MKLGWDCHTLKKRGVNLWMKKAISKPFGHCWAYLSHQIRAIRQTDLFHISSQSSSSFLSLHSVVLTSETSWIYQRFLNMSFLSTYSRDREGIHLISFPVYLDHLGLLWVWLSPNMVIWPQLYSSFLAFWKQS